MKVIVDKKLKTIRQPRIVFIFTSKGDPSVFFAKNCKIAIKMP